MSVDAVEALGRNSDAGTEAPDSENGPRFREVIGEREHFTRGTVILHRPAQAQLRVPPQFSLWMRPEEALMVEQSDHPVVVRLVVLRGALLHEFPKHLSFLGGSPGVL